MADCGFDNWVSFVSRGFKYYLGKNSGYFRAELFRKSEKYQEFGGGSGCYCLFNIYSYWSYYFSPEDCRFMEKNLIIKKQEEEIKELKKEKVKLKKLVYLDYLTKLYNRRGLIEVGKVYFKAVKNKDKNRRKNEIKFLSIIFLDIDDFKKINDKYGHSRGDKVLKSFANFLRKNFRETDVISRWGGEEFVVLLFNTPHQLAIEKTINTRKKIENFVFSGLKLTSSLGVLSYHKEKSLEELVDKADKLMYQAKRKGKNQVVVG